MNELAEHLADVLATAYGVRAATAGPVLSAEPAFRDWAAVSEAVAAVAASFGNVIGISGSQGSGKSTLARVLCQYLEAATDEPAAAVSLDDFYLTRRERAALAAAVHPLLRTRGVPGTHEHERVAELLDRVRVGERNLELPVFDKGADDRAGERAVRAGQLVLEGWCLGLEAVDPAALVEPVNELERSEDPQAVWRRWVNAALAAHYAPLWQRVDFWIHLRVPGFAQVFEWRREQEQALPPDQRMDDAALRRFIAHYERWTHMLWTQAPPGPGLVLEIDAHHGVDPFRCRSVADA